MTEFWTRDTPSDEALDAVSLDNSEFGGVFDATLGSVTFVAGTNDSGAVGYTSVNQESQPGTLVTTGTLSYTADYKVVELSDVTVSGSTVSADTRVESAAITLSADFDAGTLTGTHRDLTVAGTIVASDLDGAVTYRGVNGALDGMIGVDGVLGGFHGNDTGLVYVGGFVGAAN